ncbi:delta(14)-sterol reductase TM7SF2-like isoform X2 [Haliotis cracherodii]|uniref:delta(14)-sterol reductase TM7SF2-like isoform X2 n=1 Tax=Haliotis cracherodii TaxID=6455 RepID=UPI0039EB9D7E
MATGMVKSPPSKSRNKSRSRSRSRGRSTGKSSRSASKSPARTKSKSPSRTQSKSPSRSSRTRERTTVVKKEIVVTPTRQSTRIADLVDNEKKVSTRSSELLKSEVRNNMADKKDKAKPAAKTRATEFGGPVGALFITLSLPLVMYYINLACTKTKCTILELPKFPKNIWLLFDMEATLLFFGWLAFQAVLAMIPVGRVVEGLPLPSGKRLKYRCNGFFAFVASLIAFGICVYFNVPLVKMVHAKFFRIMTSAILFSAILSIFLYIKARAVPVTQLAPGGNTGNALYDFFIGHELNPRIGSFDLKFFCELRPGLIGWVILNFIFVLKAYQDTQAFPPALTLVVAFQTLYVADALWFEQWSVVLAIQDAILTTMDIIHDGFGFMLVFGDLAWVPFLYCLQPRFLLDNDPKLAWYSLAGIALLNVFGYMTFRRANSQKNEFRKNPFHPSLADLESIPTSSGKRLLVGGLWGMCRKPNYLGDLMMALAWSLPCGMSLIPYFYPVYFAILLVHRERRDGAQCQKKYGSSWNRYCERVPYRIIPYVY